MWKYKRQNRVSAVLLVNIQWSGGGQTNNEVMNNGWHLILIWYGHQKRISLLFHYLQSIYSTAISIIKGQKKIEKYVSYRKIWILLLLDSEAAILIPFQKYEKLEECIFWRIQQIWWEVHFKKMGSGNRVNLEIRKVGFHFLILNFIWGTIKINYDRSSFVLFRMFIRHHRLKRQGKV